MFSSKRVGLRYGRNEETLSDISFALPRGSFTFLTGPSGAGKTSLLKLIYMRMRPSRGLINMMGKDTSLMSLDEIILMKRRMGVVLQDFRLIDHLNVFENTALPLRLSGGMLTKYRQDVISLLRWVGLGHRLNAYPPTLSAGEKQRVAIARSVMNRPELLIADEPTGNVDDMAGKKLIRLFAELNQQGTTVIIATHDQALIPHDASRLNLHKGQLSSVVPAYTPPEVAS